MSKLGCGPKLQLFPMEVWDLISQLLQADDVLNLILMGNVAVNARIKRVSNVKIIWKSSSYCDWTKCNPFISAFSRVQSLSLTTWLPEHPVSKKLNVKLLPPHLTSLSLQYSGALDMLTLGTPMLALPLLTSLSILDTYAEKRQVHLGLSWISLTQFPPSLLHLRLHATVTNSYHYFSDQIKGLPPNLKTIDIGLPQAGAAFTPHPSSAPYSLTSAIFVTKLQHTIIDTSHFAKTLQHLEFSGKVHYYGREIRFDFVAGTPLREIFPQLHTLILPVASVPPLPWKAFEAFPLTLTRIAARFDFSHDELESHLYAVETLNLMHARDDYLDLDSKPGAPAMIRHLTIYNPYDVQILDFLPFFPLIETLEAPPMTTTRDMPYLPHLRTVKVGRFATPLALLPPSLTSVNCDVFSIKQIEQRNLANTAQHLIGAIEPPNKLSHLVRLCMQSRISHELISLLSDSLEHLEGAVSTQDQLEALVHKANVENKLPLLTTLAIKATQRDRIDRPDTIRIGVNTIPRHIKSLTLSGPFELLPSQPSDSLYHHPNITSLELITSDYPEVILSHLPRRLLKLHCKLSKQADLNDPQMIDALLNLPPYLRELVMDLDPSIFVIPPSSWFIPVKYSLIKLLPLSSFRSGAEMHLLLTSMLPPPFTSSHLLFLVSECFVSSCLPRTLSVLKVPMTSTHSPSTFPKLRSVSRQAFERLWLSPEMTNVVSTIVQGVLIFKLPLFGLFVPLQYKVNKEIQSSLTSWTPKLYLTLQAKALPPRISVLSTERDSKSWNAVETTYIELQEQNRANDALALASPNLEKNVNRWLRRTCFNVLNILIWLQLRYILPINRQSNPLLSYYSWINIIGSTLAIPVLSIVHHKSIQKAQLLRNIKRQKRSRLFFNLFLSISAVSLVAGLSWATNLSAAIALGAPAPQWTLQSRTWSTLFLCVGESILAVIAGTFLL